MAYSSLPTVSAGQGVRASWGNLVDANFEDHESRLVDAEAAIAVLEPGSLLVATVVLTDAQIKAMPTTPIQVVAAQGSGFAIELLQARLSTALTSAYTNVNADGYIVLRMSGGDEHSAYVLNDSSSGIGLTYLTTLLTEAEASVSLGKWLETTDPAAGRGAIPHVSTSAYDNEALQIMSVNGAGSPFAGDFTGGNAANTMTVRVWYAKVAVP
jgi:hypothetical protein